MINGAVEIGRDTPIETDVLIIGAGPVGLFGAYYSGFRALSVTVVDSREEIGGQVTAMYPEKLIHDVAGYRAVSGAELIDNLIDQASSAAPRFLLGRTVTDLAVGTTHVTIGLDNGTRIEAGAVILATGNGTFRPRPLPAAAGYDGNRINYSITGLKDLAESTVMVVGGGDSAVDWALHVEPLAGPVHLVHRRERFRAHEASLRTLADSPVHVHVPTEVDHVTDDGNRLVVGLRHLVSGEAESVTVDHLVTALGFIADQGPVSSWGITMSGRYIEVDTTMRTNLERVFAAGDATDYPGKVRLIVVGFGEIATAVNHAASMIHPEQGIFPGHSTESAAAI